MSEHSREQATQRCERLLGGRADDPKKGAIMENQPRIRHCRRQPAGESVAALVIPEVWLLNVGATLNALKITPHVLAAPRRIAELIGNGVPIAIVGVEDDHCIVGSAAA